jgi:hypothetical protein
MSAHVFPCTGGWCKPERRELCRHYHAPNPQGVDVRLCIKGADGVFARPPVPVTWHAIGSRLEAVA